ncbi:hypothetical protein ACN28S_08300 [Cystobacter fuscus]
MTNSQQKPASKTLAIPAEAGERLVLGEISPAEFLGIPRERLYEIATRGHELLVTGKLKEALEIFKGLVAASPHDSVFHCNRRRSTSSSSRSPRPWRSTPGRSSSTLATWMRWWGAASCSCARTASSRRSRTSSPC